MKFIFIDSTNNFPLKYSAGNTKFKLMAKGLTEKGYEVLLINDLLGTKGMTNEYREIYSTNFKIISYPSLNKCKNIYNCYKDIRNFLNEEKAGIIMTSSTKFLNLIILKFFSLFINIKLCYIFHEWHSSFTFNSKWKRIKGFIYDNFAGYLYNYIFPISHFLYNKSLKFGKKQFILPILGDFSNHYMFISQKSDYFLYCGNAKYFRAFKVILDTLIINVNAKIALVLYGDNHDISIIDKYITSNDLTKRTQILTNIPDEQLFTLYSNALGLIIPLEKESLQDKARFSQKIAEYLAAKRPIITCNVGEIPFYFKNGENAYILDELTINSFNDVFNRIIHNPQEAQKIGIAGYNLGNKNFNYKIVMNEMIQFLKKNEY